VLWLLKNAMVISDASISMANGIFKSASQQ
jgi:hypothetical protein